MNNVPLIISAFEFNRLVKELCAPRKICINIICQHVTCNNTSVDLAACPFELSSHFRKPGPYKLGYIIFSLFKMFLRPREIKNVDVD